MAAVRPVEFFRRSLFVPSTRAYVFAFEFRVPGAISAADFLRHLTVHSGDQFEHADLERVLAMQYWPNDSHNRVAGMLVTARPHQRQALLQSNSEGKQEVRVVGPRPGQRIADVNFVLVGVTDVDKQVARGVYVAHRGSCSTKVFGKILAKRFELLRRKEKKETESALVDESETGQLTTSQTRELQKSYPQNRFEFEQLLDRANFNQRLARLTSCDAIDYAVPAIDRSKYGSLGQLVKKERRRLAIVDAARTGNRITDYLAKFIKNKKIEEGTVHGKNQNGKLDSVSIDHEILSLTSFDHDTIVVTGNVQIESVGRAAVFADLGELMDNRPNTFLK